MRIRSFAALALLLATGCATSRNILADNQPTAMQIAADRAKFDLPCATPVVKLLSSEMTVPPLGQGQWSKSGRVAKYVIQADGCGKSKTFDVLCQEGDAGCAMLDNK
jgi:hypothetical protein